MWKFIKDFFVRPDPQEMSDGYMEYCGRVTYLTGQPTIAVGTPDGGLRIRFVRTGDVVKVSKANVQFGHMPKIIEKFKK